MVFAGVDYEAILRAAELEAADVIIWDGGNNDTPFYKPGKRSWLAAADLACLRDQLP